jgi:spermidine synthase
MYSLPDSSANSVMQYLFAATILLNALLLFLVQPMIARMLLPFLGGAPSVWNTCMVFFQAMLLCGYAYAHLATKLLGTRRQIVLHLVLLLSVVLVFPIEIRDSAILSLNGETQPMWWLLGQLLVMVGLPFFMLSTGGPLLQQWFSTTNHRTAKDPYFLYSASNMGSLAALLGYPLLMEPILRLMQQTWLWVIGYVLLLLMIFACAMAIRKANTAPVETIELSATTITKVEELSLMRRARWVLLSFVPSSLMLGVTNYLTTDISPVPLLWVVPLALYLLTFILAFAQKPMVALNRLQRWMPLLALALIILMMMGLRGPIWLLTPLHLIFLFVAALVCHRLLADDRPPAIQLTEFYLWLSVGGVLGGIFNSLIAPIFFRSIIEYPFAIVLALMMRPRPKDRPQQGGKRWYVLAGPAGVYSLTAGLVLFLPHLGLEPVKVLLLSLLVPAAICYLFVRYPYRYALAMAALMLGNSLFPGLHERQPIYAGRNFFGVLRVAQDRDGKFQQLYHGRTLHGSQFLDPQRRCEPLSYYHRRGPLGQALEAFTASQTSTNIAVVGLGTGAMACYTKPGQDWTFYEIDPAVLDIARNERYFTYLQKCTAAPVKIVLGDARLQLRNAPDGHYGLIVLDAFSSDAIPMHLLTREALDLYLSKLARGGWLAFHVSNNFLDLHSVIGNLAKNANLVCLASEKHSVNKDEGQNLAMWVVMTHNNEDLGDLLKDSRWQRLEGNAQGKIWTDDYSNILSVLKWR